MDVTWLIWIMGIGGIIFWYVKTHVKFEKITREEFTVDKNTSPMMKDTVMMKNLKDLNESYLSLFEQQKKINKYISVQQRINLSSDKIMKHLVERIREIEDENLTLKEKLESIRNSE